MILRDGRHLVGVLRSFDQFSNMVLQETSERRILVVPKENSDRHSSDDDKTSSPATICYQTDIQLGLFIVRGDNVVLLGEVEDADDCHDGSVQFVSLEDFETLQEAAGERALSVDWDFDMDLVA